MPVFSRAINCILRHTVVLCVVPILVFQLASCALDQKKTEVAKDYTNVTVDSDTQHEFTQALVFLKDKNYDAAIGLLKTVVSKEKRLPAPFVNLGMAYLRKGDKKEDRKLAEDAFVNAIKLDPVHRVASNELGQLYRKTGRFKLAKEVYSNALGKHNDYLPIVRNLGILCELYMQDLACALEQYEYYLEQKPDDKQVKGWVIDLKRRLGQ